MFLKYTIARIRRRPLTTRNNKTISDHLRTSGEGEAFDTRLKWIFEAPGTLSLTNYAA